MAEFINKSIKEIRYTPYFAGQVKLISRLILDTKKNDNKTHLLRISRKLNEIEKKRDMLLD